MAEMDVEWMFADAASGALGIQALASLNPLRWSGSLDFKKALEQMEALQDNNEGHRPIIIKIPSGITSAEKQCKNVAEAIDLIKKKSPEYIAAELAALDAEKKKERLLKEIIDTKESLKEAEEILQDTSAKAKEAKAQLHAKLQELGKQKEAFQCQWMYGDAGSNWGKIGLGGFGAWGAHLNPSRWSAKSSMGTTQEALEAVAQDDKEKDRPIILKVWKGDNAPYEEKYESVEKVVAYLQTITSAMDPSVQPLEDANAEAESRLTAATQLVEQWKKAVTDAQAAAEKEGVSE